MSDDNTYFLVEVATKKKTGPIREKGGDPIFPDEVRNWGDVLDCRHEPYTGFPYDELLHRAEHAFKRFILVLESQLPD